MSDNNQSKQRIVNVDYEYTRGHEKRYVANIEHEELKAFRTIRDTNLEILKVKIIKQYEVWNTQYEKELNKEKAIKNKEEADKLTKEAKNAQDQLNKIILHTLEIDDAVNWDSLKSSSPFNEDRPVKPQKPKDFDVSSLKTPPNKPDFKIFSPNFSLLERMFPSLRKRKEIEATERYNRAIEEWSSNLEDVNYYNSMLERMQNEKIEQYESQIQKWHREVDLWKKREEKHYAYEEARNKEVDVLKKKYNLCDSEAILQYCEIVLNNSDYSTFGFPKDFELDYIEDTKTLIVEYTLPVIEDIPTLKEVKYIASKNDFKEIHVSNAELLRNYDNVIYQILLRTIHELFEADTINAIHTISINGWVNALDRATGQTQNSCIASIHVMKDDFLKIDLSLIDSKLCFKGLKGIGASKLSTLTPIKPIQQIEKNDSRFVDSHNVSGQLEEGYNLASMSWEDFEHLVRELFHKEFSVNGGEVKVTQSSRDGGVDAIAFNPDPLMGGKIVIQAKRYTNVVGVSAVRDLWGTTMNEGASKGILVTTSNYGSDAYDFVKNKPLELINGNNLLFLLGKHGYKARIDLKEAKKLNKDSSID